MEVAVVATSSQVPPVELEMGVALLREAGFGVRVYPQCRARHFTYAGTDDERAGAFFDAATDDRFSIVWCARGGYGATRILPLLADRTARHGKPGRKLLIGYSDVTALHAYVSREWNWPTLHGLMPASTDFNPKAPEWSALIEAARGRRPNFAWEQSPLTFLTPPADGIVEAPLAGGNLTLLAATCGTPYSTRLRNTLLFLEDVGEAWYRLDRMVTQLSQAGAFNGVRGIVLGNFKGCRDDAARGLRRAGTTEEMDLREPIAEDAALEEIFGSVGRRFGFPVAKGLPVGHGPGHWPLPLNARYRLDAGGRLKLIDWEWFG